MTSSKASSVSLTVLGSGDAFATGGRSQSGYFVRSGNTGVLMDAGPDLLGSLKRKGLAPGDIDIVMISHMHGDHYAGIPFLILEYMYESKRRRPVHIVGPPRLESRCWRMMKLDFPNFDLHAIRHLIHFVEIYP